MATELALCATCVHAPSPMQQAAVVLQLVIASLRWRFEFGMPRNKCCSTRPATVLESAPMRCFCHRAARPGGGIRAEAEGAFAMEPPAELRIKTGVIRGGFLADALHVILAVVGGEAHRRIGRCKKTKSEPNAAGRFSIGTASGGAFFVAFGALSSANGHIREGAPMPTCACAHLQATEET